MRHPRVLQLIMDSLRYWVNEMHVDGFRFDLASALARELHEVDRLSAFFDIVHQDPVISQVKLIAEPWDLGEGGYQVGNFPVGWTEWNGKFRDAIRRFWKGEGGTVAEMATRLAGSSDLYEHSGRRPYASINLITAHDGFTLEDLVSYNHKHNEANKENGRDGESHNNSWNCGVEGPTTNMEILALRARQKRNLMATLLLSQGVPMLSGGDELGRTQSGNNNAYCQDNETSWYNWELDEEKKDFQSFVRYVVQLRKTFPALARRNFLQGLGIRGDALKDVSWYGTNGIEMDDAAWNVHFVRCLGVMLLNPELGDGAALHTHDSLNALFIMMNGHHDHVRFVLPGHPKQFRWERILDTARRNWDQRYRLRDHTYRLVGRSLSLFQLVAVKEKDKSNER
jgi:isoamylase